MNSSFIDSSLRKKTIKYGIYLICYFKYIIYLIYYLCVIYYNRMHHTLNTSRIKKFINIILNILLLYYI